MAFNHKQYNANFVQRLKTGGDPVAPDPKYQVRLVPADVAPGETYWKVVGIHHLLPEENMSNHNIYVEALDEQGNRLRPPAWLGWTVAVCGIPGHHVADDLTVIPTGHSVRSCCILRGSFEGA